MGNVKNEIASICAKFGADVVNTSKVTSRKTEWPGLFGPPCICCSYSDETTAGPRVYRECAEYFTIKLRRDLSPTFGRSGGRQRIQYTAAISQRYLTSGDLEPRPLKFRYWKLGHGLFTPCGTFMPFQFSYTPLQIYFEGAKFYLEATELT